MRDQIEAQVQIANGIFHIRISNTCQPIQRLFGYSIDTHIGCTPDITFRSRENDGL